MGKAHFENGSESQNERLREALLRVGEKERREEMAARERERELQMLKQENEETHKMIHKFRTDRRSATSTVFGLKSERITDVGYAEQMQDHRRLRVVSEEIARKLYDAHLLQRQGDTVEAEKITREVTVQLAKEGSLWSTEGYGIEDERSRIRNQHEYICMRSGASLTDSADGFTWASEMRTRIPSADTANPITKIAEDEDSRFWHIVGPWADVLGENRPRVLADEIRANPGIAAEIEDVYVYNPAFEGVQVASANRTATYEIIENELNPQRGDAAIRAYIANTSRLERMTIPGENGETRLIQDPTATADQPKFIFDPRYTVKMPNGGAYNRRSASMHMDTLHPTHVGYLAWSLPAAPMRVSFEHDSQPNPIEVDLHIGWETVMLERVDEEMRQRLQLPS